MEVDRQVQGSHNDQAMAETRISRRSLRKVNTECRPGGAFVKRQEMVDAEPLVCKGGFRQMPMRHSPTVADTVDLKCSGFFCHRRSPSLVIWVPSRSTSNALPSANRGARRWSGIHCDSIQWREQNVDLWSAGNLVIHTEEKKDFGSELAFPDAILDDAAQFDQLVNELADLAARRKPKSARTI
jgi:hypothetical protein